MEKGQLRCDANVSIRPVGTTELGTKVELKNLNTISGVKQGVEYEIRRQKRRLKTGRKFFRNLKMEPRGKTEPPRCLEGNGDDYRYFPDPDLMPVDRCGMGGTGRKELLRTFDKQGRYMADESSHGDLSPCADRPLCEYFEKTASLIKDPVKAANWVVNDLLLNFPKKDRRKKTGFR